MSNESQSATTANALGHQLSHAAQLDGHFYKCQAEYEAMARAVGIQPGWHVLDAGCGTGVFLPLLSHLVGSAGKVTAMDLAPDNRNRAQELVNTLDLQHNVTIEEGDVTKLPYADNTFDAVWCANVSQYLTDEQFTTALHELIRVTRSGGVVAIKEFDLTTWQFLPADPLLMARMTQCQQRQGMLQVNSALRAPLFRTWFLQAGLTNVQLKSYVSESQFPLDPQVQGFLQNLMAWMAKNAQGTTISDEDKAIWRQLGEIQADDHILKRPDFYNRESHILALGLKA